MQELNDTVHIETEPELELNSEKCDVWRLLLEGNNDGTRVNRVSGRLEKKATATYGMSNFLKYQKRLPLN